MNGMNDKLIEELFGSKAKARVLKLFAHNPRLALPVADIAKRIRIDQALCRRTIMRLVRLGVLKSYDIKDKKKKKS